MPTLGARLMESGIFKFILHFSLRDQVRLVLMSAAGLPFLYLTLELPKIIVNEAIDGTDFPKHLLGWAFEQIPYLLLLCGLFLALVIVSGTLKYFTSTYRYRVGDRLLRRLRYDLVERLLRFPSAEFRNMSSGQVISMITAETSNLGYFFAEAFAVPAVALGTLSTIVLFMFMQNWLMGVAAIALYPVQIYLIPKIQRQINLLQRQEVQAMRDISQRIGDVVAGVSEIHGHDTAQYELADFSQRLGTVFGYRVQMSSKRYIANILNQFFSQFTPFLFLSIGGYLVIVGQLSLGSLVAVLAAYKDMYSPWKDLIDYYQKSEDARVRYDQLKDFFARTGLFEKSMIEAEPVSVEFNQSPLVVSNVVVEKEKGDRPVNGASLVLALPTHTVIRGSGGSGREEFARLLARQVLPQSGSVSLGDRNLASLPDSVTGRRIGYIGPQTFLGSGSIRDVLFYPLLRRPRSDPQGGVKESSSQAREKAESRRAGNSAYDAASDWIDYAAAGCKDAAALEQRVIELLGLVDLEQEVYEIGLRGTVSPNLRPDLAARLIEARRIFHQRLHAAGKDLLIERFDGESYNSHASVAENILFGTPAGPYFAIENLGHNDYMRKVIEQTGLTTVFLEAGRKLAVIEAEIFRDLPPGHEFFERFSFIRFEDLPAFEAILRHAESQGIAGLDDRDREKLLVLPFKLVEAQHHVDVIDENIKQRLLAARRAFASGLPENLRGAVQFFEKDSYNAASSIVENILFGKAASSKAGSAAQIGRMVLEVVDELGLRGAIISVGLEYQVGAAGARLTAVQRQKIALARCLVKRPDILIMSDALSTLDIRTQEKILAHIRLELTGRSLILFESHEDRRREFEKVLHMDQGRFIEDHAAAEAGAGQIKLEQPGMARALGLNEIVAMLMDIPLFEGIDRSKLKLLAFTSERVNFEQDQVVFRQGDAGQHAYVVIEGEVEVVLESVNGSKVVATLGRNELFGEMALLAKMPRTTTIRAKTPLVLLSVSQDVFLPLVEENSEIAISMMRVLAERLASTLRDYGRVMAERG
ncbi:MAG TPA: ABC transporter transmembrane domain-containing protein [Xanthomonadales bacterium]|nr:ABC transporter transmembrane domain-containing protein [Xanthomonadales bacterium]